MTPGSLLLDMLVSGIGFVLFTYGRKQVRLPQVVAGLVLMLSPFFITSAAGLILGTAVLSAGLWWALRLGW